MVLKPVRRRYRANNSSPAYEVSATSSNSNCRSPLTRARKSGFLCLIVEGLSLAEEGLGCASFQPQRKAFFNYKVSIRDHINDSLRLAVLRLQGEAVFRGGEARVLLEEAGEVALIVKTC